MQSPEYAVRTKICRGCRERLPITEFRRRPGNLKEFQSRCRACAPICSMDGCGMPAIVRGWCNMHYIRWKRHGDPRVQLHNRKPDGSCREPACWERVEADKRGWCALHYERWARTGRAEPSRWDNVPGRRATGGYRYLRLPAHVGSSKAGYVAEHRVVMEDHLRRALLPDETVHHINGVRHDNRLENLELWVSNHPKGQRVEQQVEWAVELLRRYAPERLRG